MIYSKIENLKATADQVRNELLMFISQEEFLENDILIQALHGAIVNSLSAISVACYGLLDVKKETSNDFEDYNTHTS